MVKVQHIKLKEDLQPMTGMTDNCNAEQPSVQYESSNGAECILQLCDAVIHYNKALKMIQMIETTLTADDWKDTK